MTNRVLIDMIREELFAQLQIKTGWGRNEVMEAFEKAVSAAVLRYLDA